MILALNLHLRRCHCHGGKQYAHQQDMTAEDVSSGNNDGAAASVDYVEVTASRIRIPADDLIDSGGNVAYRELSRSNDTEIPVYDYTDANTPTLPTTANGTDGTKLLVMVQTVTICTKRYEI